MEPHASPVPGTPQRAGKRADLSHIRTAVGATFQVLPPPFGDFLVFFIPVTAVKPRLLLVCPAGPLSDAGFHLSCLLYIVSFAPTKKVSPSAWTSRTLLCCSLRLHSSVSLCFPRSEATRIVGVPQHQSAVRGSTARFECQVKSDPSLPVTVTWTKDDKPLNLGWR